MKRVRRISIAVHRDLGYFFTGLIVIYCLSGIALNHIEEWNPDFIIDKKTIRFSGSYEVKKINDEQVKGFSSLVGEGQYKIYDYPTADQLKIYYENATLHLNFSTREAVYEKISRRPVFYQFDILHKNGIKGWRYVADIFAAILIIISISGLLILKGKKGLTGRGNWLLIAGLFPPIVAIIISLFIV